MATASRHLASSRPDHARAATPQGACTPAEGLDAETFRGFLLAGDLFLLTSFFIEPKLKLLKVKTVGVLLQPTAEEEVTWRE
jgi:hypothetical protein